jgi:triacylglycerol lipase
MVEVTPMTITWKDLLDPGSATNFFDPPPEKPFYGTATGYNDVNAWWLMELSRLVYCRDKGLRATSLVSAGLREVDFIEVGSTEGFVVAPPGDAWAALVFRGTESLRDWMINAEFSLSPWPFGGGRVHQGFRDALESVWDRVSAALGKVAPGANVFYSGYSLGAALATLAASRRKPAATYTFGSPLVGDDAFGQTLNGQPLFRVVNNIDIVTDLPPPIPLFLPYKHVGQLVHVGHPHSSPQVPRHSTLAEVVGLSRLTAVQIMEGFEGWKRSFATWLEKVQQQFPTPPKPLADHAPIDYVDLLGTVAGIGPRISISRLVD